VGAASSHDYLISRLEAAPTGSFFMVTWTFRISALCISNISTKVECFARFQNYYHEQKNRVNIGPKCLLYKKKNFY